MDINLINTNGWEPADHYWIHTNVQSDIFRLGGKKMNTKCWEECMVRAKKLTYSNINSYSFYASEGRMAHDAFTRQWCGQDANARHEWPANLFNSNKHEYDVLPACLALENLRWTTFQAESYNHYYEMGVALNKSNDIAFATPFYGLYNMDNPNKFIYPENPECALQLPTTKKDKYISASSFTSAYTGETKNKLCKARCYDLVSRQKGFGKVQGVDLNKGKSAHIETDEMDYCNDLKGNGNRGFKVPFDPVFRSYVQKVRQGDEALLRKKFNHHKVAAVAGKAAVQAAVVNPLLAASEESVKIEKAKKAFAECNNKTGYKFENGVCRPFEVTCTNGKKKFHTSVTKDGEACQSCDTGHTLDGDKCREFEVTCPNGTPKHHTFVTKDGQACQSCNKGYYGDGDPVQCREIVVTCKNGKPKLPTEVQKSGKACKSCNESYTMGMYGEKCILSCIRLFEKNTFVTATGTPDYSMTLNDCKEAATNHGKTFRGQDDYRHSDEPKGCFQWGETDFYFNNSGSQTCNYRNGYGQCVKKVLDGGTIRRPYRKGRRGGFNRNCLDDAGNYKSEFCKKLDVTRCNDDSKKFWYTQENGEKCHYVPDLYPDNPIKTPDPSLCKSGACGYCTTEKCTCYDRYVGDGGGTGVAIWS